jgi:hypothetical protein
MALTRRSTPSKNAGYTPVENLEPRDYDMRLVYVADLGVQEGMIYKGTQKPDSQQICLGFEVIGETVAINDEEWPRILWAKPFNIFRNMTSLGNELKMYKLFNPGADENTTPDWEAQLRKPCVGTVTNTEKDGNVYDNISGLMPMPAKYQADVEQATTNPCIGDADDPDNRCNLALFGLAKYVFDKRLGQVEASGVTDDDVAF